MSRPISSVRHRDLNLSPAGSGMAALPAHAAPGQREAAPALRHEMRQMPAGDERPRLTVVASAEAQGPDTSTRVESRRARLGTARGLILGLAISIALWACIGLLVFLR